MGITRNRKESKDCEELMPRNRTVWADNTRPCCTTSNISDDSFVNVHVRCRDHAIIDCWKCVRRLVLYPADGNTTTSGASISYHLSVFVTYIGTLPSQALCHPRTFGLTCFRLFHLATETATVPHWYDRREKPQARGCDLNFRPTNSSTLRYP